jgi:hypothetical protein
MVGARLYLLNLSALSLISKLRTSRVYESVGFFINRFMDRRGKNLVVHISRQVIFIIFIFIF